MPTDHIAGDPEPILPPPAAVTGFVETWRRVVTDPRGFFMEMPQAGGLQEPLTFLAVCAALNSLGTFLLHWSISGATGTFIVTVLAGFLSAAALTLVAQHLFDGRAGFEPMFRVVAYAAAPVVFFWVPRLWVLALLYTWYLQVRGTERVNEFEATPAILTVAIKTGALMLLTAGLRGWSL